MLTRTWKPRILFWDLESAGIQALYADRGYVVCFGYKWAGDRHATVKTVLDYPGKHCQDDTNLLKHGLSVLEQADLIVAHYGDGHDRPFFESRLRRIDLSPIPMVRQIDTWRILKEKFKLSSNRLKAACEFFDLPVKKMEKGRGWPDWWMGAMRGHAPSINSMAKYCGVDVDCLEPLLNKLGPVIPNKYLIHMGTMEERVCCRWCGGTRIQYRGLHLTQGRAYKRFQCRSCGRWGHDKRAVLIAPQSAATPK